MSRHPWTLPPPECRDVHFQPTAFPKTVKTSVIAGIRLACEIDIFSLRDARNEFNPGSCILPEPHCFPDLRSLSIIQLRDIKWDYAVGPAQRFFRTCINVQ